MLVAQILPRWNPLTSWMRRIEDFQGAARRVIGCEVRNEDERLPGTLLFVVEGESVGIDSGHHLLHIISRAPDR